MLNTRAIKELCRRYNLSISPRRMGQNFLVDPRALERIARTIGAAQETRVLEIGAGLGALTEELLKSAGFVTAVERDKKFCDILTDRFGTQPNFQLVCADILHLNLSEYAGGIPKSLLLVGNIPFSVTSPILGLLLTHRHWVRRAVFTVQKEVAQRIVAQSGTKAYSSISVMVQVAFAPSIAFTIPPNSFYPQPKVTSAVLKLEPLPEPVIPPAEEEGILKLARNIFRYRRKTLLNALRLFQEEAGRESLEKICRKTGLDPNRRPETLTLQEIARLDQALS